MNGEDGIKMVLPAQEGPEPVKFGDMGIAEGDIRDVYRDAHDEIYEMFDAGETFYSIQASNPEMGNISEIIGNLFQDENELIENHPLRWTDRYQSAPDEVVASSENGEGFSFVIEGYPLAQEVMHAHEEGEPHGVYRREEPFKITFENQDANLDAMQAVENSIRDSSSELVGYSIMGSTDRYDRPEKVLERPTEEEFSMVAQAETPLGIPIHVGYLSNNEFGVAPASTALSDNLPPLGQASEIMRDLDDIYRSLEEEYNSM